MIPAYRYMDSHPFQKNQTPLSPYQYPNMEHFPPYMMMDPARSYVPPNGSGRNTWYSGYPMPVYSCCNGGNFFPGCYSFRPPHLPVPPHQHMHCYGGYPSCPESYYVPYVPPPHYSVEQPRYEFDKNLMMRNHHCCGCPNSLCGQNQSDGNDGKCVRIEEEKPDVQRKGSLVPVQLGDNKCPIVWIPPDHMGREKERGPSETETAKQEKECRGLNSTEKVPKFWGGWPLSDLSRLGSWLPAAKSVQNEQEEDGKKELPFPVIWMPARKDVQNMDAPVKPTVEPSRIEGPEVVKTMNQSIPGKDTDHKTEDTKENIERRCISIPVKTVKDNEEKESSRNNVKRQSSSPPKKSRLPPVCLRVDPLPKKKNSNGGSKSPSSQAPTAAGENSRLDAKIDNGKTERSSEKIIKTVEVRTHESPDGNLENKETVEVRTHESPDGNQGNKETISSDEQLLSSPRHSEEKSLGKICKDGAEETTGKEDGRISHIDTSTVVVDKGSVISPEDLVQDGGKKEKPKLSDVEAAVLIQSAYRGYEVRKWELLKKMKQLVEARQQIFEIQNRVKALELAPQDEKERMFTGEMIMRLLLRLDAIQGLHPSVREFRKSLAKELVSLQEKLDCMTINTKPKEAVQEATAVKPAEHSDIETHDDRNEVKQDETDVAIGKIFSEEANESNNMLGESNGAQPRCDDVAGFESTKSPAATHDDRKEDEQEKADVEAIGEIFTEGPNESKSLLGESEEAQPHCGTDNIDGFEDTKSPAGTYDDRKEDEQDKADVVAIGEIFTEGPNESNSLFEESEEAQPFCRIDNMIGLEGTKSPAESHDDGKEDEQNDADMVAISQIFPEGANESNSLLDESADAQPLHGIDKIASFEDAESSLADVHDENSKACEAIQVEESRELGVQNEVTSELSYKNFSKHLEGKKVGPSLIGYEKPEEAESSTEMEQNVEIVTDAEQRAGEDLQMDMEGQTDTYQANSFDVKITISVPDETGQTEDHLAADEEVLSGETAKLEEVSEAEQNEERSSHTKPDESAELPGEQTNSSSNVNIENEPEKRVGEVQHQAMTSSELENQAEQPSEESAEPVEESSDSYCDENIQNDVVTEKNEKRTEKRLVEENERMREMVEKLMEAGKEQIAIITKLSGRVKDLEKRLARKRKLRGGCARSVSRQHPTMFNGCIKTL